MQYMKEHLTPKGELDKFTIIVRDMDMPVGNRTSRQKIGEDTEELNNTINQITDIYRTLPSKSRTQNFHVHMEHSSRQFRSWLLK